jgi:hypothetical protein
MDLVAKFLLRTQTLDDKPVSAASELVTGLFEAVLCVVGGIFLLAIEVGFVIFSAVKGPDRK